MSKLDSQLTSLALLLTRVSVGLYLLLAGFGKVRGEISNGPGSFYNGPGFQGLQPDWLPNAFAAPYGYALPWVEVIVGALLVLGLFGRIAAALTGLMILSFTIAKITQLGITAQEPGPGGPFSTNYIQIAACFLLVCTGPGLWSIDYLIRKRRKTESIKTS
jgi:uncharacterized membrane protein YphA (DoxX/SURF4 family)